MRCKKWAKARRKRATRPASEIERTAQKGENEEEKREKEETKNRETEREEASELSLLYYGYCCCYSLFFSLSCLL